MPPGFVHLCLHSEYSLVDGTVRLKPLMQATAAAGMPALALTDQGNLFGLVKFYQAAETAGLKPLVGVDTWLRNPEDEAKPARLLLLAQNTVGYRHLIRLVSQSYREARPQQQPCLERAWLETAGTGLIVLSGGRDGDIGQALLAGRTERANALLAQWLNLLGDRYYLELTRTGRPREEEYISAAVDLAVRQGVPVVATNDVRFLKTTDFPAHDVRVCIRDGHTLNDPRRPHRYSPQQYLRSPEEMAALFADLPEALINSIEIAKRCNVELCLGRSYLPQFPIPPDLSLEDVLRAQARQGLTARLAAGPAAIARQQQQVYSARLEQELAVILAMGFAGYFLIVADFIQWAKEQQIPVGPGRGSGAGSLVAYALKITDLDPLPYDLLFERFLNPERVSMPDFDIDFCMDGRDRVIDYVAKRYGRDAVAQIITYGSLAAKAVVRDVGRVLGYPYNFVDRIAKLVPFELGMTLEKALIDSAELRQAYTNEQEVTALLDMAKSLEGLARNVGTHAGGVVIAPGQLTDFTPLYCEPGSLEWVTQFDKDDVERVGLVKFDFLGLRTLTIIDWALKSLNANRAQRGETPIDISCIPLDDAASFELLRRADTTAVFQLESRGMKDLIRKLQPDCFEDLIALVALFRPGPLQSGMVDDFIARKKGLATVTYPHPALEKILKPTYGVIVYQEQVMQIAQVLAGYTLGGADLLRRAMGKKKASEMAKQRETFQQGAMARGVTLQTATQIFDLMDKFGQYGFNKSHSAAYALLSYQTAWLKAHYPADFMAAVLSADLDNTDKVVIFIEACREMQLQIQPPDINRSESSFTVAVEGGLRYGLGAIKGVGRAAIDGILAARQQQPFRDLFDLCRRADRRAMQRRVMEALIGAGALDSLEPERATLMLQLPLALQLAEQQDATQNTGIGDLFGMDEPVLNQLPDLQLLPRAETQWGDEERLRAEKAALGLYLTGHPIDRYESELQHLVSGRLGELLSEAAPDAHTGRRHAMRKVVVAGLVMESRQRNTARGQMGSLVLDDRTGHVETSVFAELYDSCRALLNDDAILVISGQLGFDEYRGSWSLRAEKIQTLEQARENALEQLLLCLDATQLKCAASECVLSLRALLEPFRGGRCGITVEYRHTDIQGLLRFGSNWRVHPADALLKRLREWNGPQHLQLVYDRHYYSEVG